MSRDLEVLADSLATEESATLGPEGERQVQFAFGLFNAVEGAPVCDQLVAITLRAFGELSPRALLELAKDPKATEEDWLTVVTAMLNAIAPRDIDVYRRAVLRSVAYKAGDGKWVLLKTDKAINDAFQAPLGWAEMQEVAARATMRNFYRSLRGIFAKITEKSPTPE